MAKLLPKFLAIIVLCASLAIFWHAATMNSSMNDGDGMSASCLSVCVTGGDASMTIADSVSMTLESVVVVMVIFGIFIVCYFFTNTLDIGFFQKDRHRYLMKTMVMLR